MINFLRNTAVFCALAAFIPTLCGCTETSGGSFSSAKAESDSLNGWELTSADLISETEHSACYRVKYNSPYEEYSLTQWYVFDKNGDVMDSGKGGRVDPKIEETDGKVSVYVSAGTGVGNYREFFPETGAMSDWYQRNAAAENAPDSECNGDFVYFCSDGYFDYEEVCRKYAGNEPGVKRDGFVNTGDRLIHNGSEAFNRAKNELNEGFSYNLVDTDYDSNNDMWAVTFSTKDTLGGCIAVYLDAYGRTVLMVSVE